MNESRHDISFDSQVDLERLAEQFEAQLRRFGQRASLTDVLKTAKDEHQERLFPILLELELDHRRREGEPFDEEKYLQEFPQYESIIRQVVGAGAAGEAATVEKKGRLHEGPGSVIGRYKLLQQIGEGGFGVVYMAAQTRPIRRKLAVKIIKPGMDTKEVVARFEAERQALAMMDHPNIAKVLDAGTTDSGRPYFVMELVRGMPITEYCDHGQLTTGERLRLFITVCRAVQHAHAKGIIHRDLKPSNILIEPHDGVPVVKVIDFGVAKALGHELTEKTLFTSFAQMIGTPLYMSPEQAEINAMDVDTRSDVYSLGVLLYELLTGNTPFDRQRLATAVYEEIRRIIKEEEPPKPSKRLSSLGETLTVISERRKTEPARLSALIRGDLDWIVMKAIEKERERRYSTPLDLARDVQRHLEDDEVQARPPTRSYRLRKFVKRNRHVVIPSLLVSIALVLGFIGVSFGLFRTLALKKQLEGAVRDKNQALAETNRALKEKEEALSEKEKARRAAEETAEGRRRQLYISDMHAAQQAWSDASLDRVVDLLHRHVPEADEEDLRGFEWYYLWRLCERSRRADSLPLVGRPRRLAIAPSREWLAVGGGDGRVFVWDLMTKQTVRDGLRGPTTASALQISPGGRPGWEWVSLAFSPCGEMLAYVSRDYTRVILQSLANGSEEVLEGGGGPIYGLGFSPDGRYLATGGEDGALRVYDLAKIPIHQTQTFSDHAGRIMAVAFSPDGRLLASGGEDRTIMLQDLTDQEVRTLKGHEGSVLSLAFSYGGGEFLASGSSDGTVRLWNLETASTMELLGHRDEVRSVAFSPNGDLLASGSRDNTAILWKAATGEQIESLKGHSHNVECVAFWPHDERLTLLTGSSDRTLKFWDLEHSEPNILTNEQPVEGILFLPDGNTLASRHASSNTVTLWDLQTGERLPVNVTVDETISSFAASKKFLAIGSLGNVELRDVGNLAGNRAQLSVGGEAAFTALEFSNDGGLVAAGTEQGSLFVWDVGSKQVVFQSDEHNRHSKWVTDLSFSPTRKWLASTSDDGTCRLWDYESGQHVQVVKQSRENLTTVQFSPQGTYLACGGFINEVEMWRVGEQIAKRAEVTLRGHSDGIYLIAFSDDECTVFTACDNNTLRLWDVREQQGRISLRGHESAVECMALSPDETLLASGSRDGTIRLWRAATKQEVAAVDW